MFTQINSSTKFAIVCIIILFLSGCAVLTPKAKPDYTVEVADMDFVFVKGGTFQMGSTNYPDEQPIHAVTIPDLYVGMYEVTFEQFDKFCTLPTCEPPYDEGWGRGDRPVIHVSWYDANAYAAWLSKQTGHTFRLPSESEWEYFARAGTTTPYWSGDSLPAQTENCRNCNAEYIKKTTPVGMFAPNPWGLYDILGNTFEWVMDDYQKSYENAPNNGDPVILPKAKNKSMRGGSWRARTGNSTVTAREFIIPQSTNNRTSFRLVLEPGPGTPVIQRQ